jgi:hypothetical protein
MNDTMHRPRIGDAVYSADGDQFAYVKEVRGDYFKLDVPMAQDYWLACTHISGIADGQVRLRFVKSELDDHRLEAPPLEQVATADAGILSNEEMVDQRERMERELAAQRERLRTGQ